MRRRKLARYGANSAGISLRPAPGPARARRDPPPALDPGPVPLGASLVTPVPEPLRGARGGPEPPPSAGESATGAGGGSARVISPDSGRGGSGAGATSAGRAG